MLTFSRVRSVFKTVSVLEIFQKFGVIKAVSGGKKKEKKEAKKKTKK